MLAFYLRLSKADGEKESNSICSQRELLWKNLEKYGLSEEEVREYIDDGYSGKNWNRPGIKQLFNDIQKKQIQVILVKDFSRFGRNYREVSEYLERTFPKMGIRFIAVNNEYDSKEQKDNISGILQNIFYDYESEENAKKIRNVLSQLKKEGKYMAPTAPYGYKKDLFCPSHLMIDKEAAEVVKLIFQMRCEEKSGAEIARYLNEKGIASPYDYKNGKKGEHIWQSEVIWAMVRNRVYLGNLVAGKYQTIETGSQRQKKLPKENWIELEAVHEAIVGEEIFRQAQKKQKIQKEKQEERNIQIQEKKQELKKTGYNQKKQGFDLTGRVICSGCGHRMNRKGQKSPFFFCKYYYYACNPLCLKSGISEKFLFKVIWKILKERNKEMEEKEIYRQYKKFFQEKLKQQSQKEKRMQQRKKLEQYLLYEKWKNGWISEQVYQKKKKIEGLQVDKKEKKEMEYNVFFSGLFLEMIEKIFLNSAGMIHVKFRIKEDTNFSMK